MSRNVAALLVVVVVCLTAFGACGGGGGSSGIPPAPDAGLPPDPGAEGAATIEGIDLNQDGLRDDIERFIALEYADHQDLRQLLVDAAQWIQVAIMDGGSTGATEDALTKLAEVVGSPLSAPPNTVRNALEELRATALNTDARSLRYISALGRMGGAIIVAGTTE